MTFCASLRTKTIALALGATALAVPLVETMQQPAHAASQDIVSTSESQKDIWRQELLNQVNQYRASEGLYPFKYSATLSQISQDESNRAVIDENYNHSMNFVRDSRAGAWNDAGEITALSYRISTKDLVDFWKSSPPHNKMMLSDTLDVVGIGTTQVDGMLTHINGPWQLLATIDGFSYENGNEPSDTKTMVTNAASGYNAPTLRGSIAAKYNSTGGSSVYGNPTTNEISDGKGGVYQKFQKGSARYVFYWTPKYGTHPVKVSGGIGGKWQASGGGTGAYGVPISDETRISDGSGYYQNFRKGNATYKVMWSRSTGAHTIKETGAIGQRWKKNGFERGYGYPVTDEVSSNGVVYQVFEKGTSNTTVYWTSRQGTWVA